jgi:AraC-like DNA-binding protein
MNVRQKHPTTISSWAIPLLDTLKNSGVNAESLLMNAGIDISKLSNPGARIRVEKMNALWKQSVRITGNENIGLVAAANVGPTTLHALGFALMVSNSLMDAFERVRRFYRIVSDTIEVDLKTSEDLFVVSLNIDETEPHASSEALDMALAAIVLFARMLLSEELNPVNVEFMREKPKDTKLHDQIFKAPVAFNKPTNRIFFQLSDVMLNLPSANAEVARRNDDIVIDYLANFNEETASNQVHVKIIELLPLGEPSIEKLAKALGISTRSLNRSLQKENFTYRAILEDIRKHLAVEYIKKPQYSIIEIAFQLGYSDSGNFTRAFKRWYRISPSKYRMERGL